MAIQTGEKVQWDWGNGTASGTVVQIYTSRITKEIKGTEVTRDATDEEPAYLIEQEDGAKALKSCTEVSAV